MLEILRTFYAPRLRDSRAKIRLRAVPDTRPGSGKDYLNVASARRPVPLLAEDQIDVGDRRWIASWNSSASSPAPEHPFSRLPGHPLGVSVDRMRTKSRLPPWLVRSEAVGRILEMLQILLRVPCS